MPERTVTSSIEVNVSPVNALRAFIDLDMLRGWWGVDRGLVEAKPGGAWTLTWDRSEKGFRYVSTGIIAALTPGAELVVDNLVYLNPDRPPLGPMRLTVRVAGTAKGSVVTVTQEGYRSGPDWDWYYEAVSQAWPVALGLLRDFLNART